MISYFKVTAPVVISFTISKFAFVLFQHMISQIGSKPPTELSHRLCTVFIKTKEEISSLAKQAPENTVESVHLIRKRLKFLRAFAKLTQFCSKEDYYKKINILLRDCGRLISDCRDAHVRTLLFEEFKQEEAGSLFQSIIKKLSTLNDSQTRKIEKQLLTETSVLGELIADLSKEEMVSYFSSLEADTESLFSGYSVCYQKSYNAFHSELTNHEADLLHEWRKRTKDLQYQQEILVELIPNDLPPTLAEVSELCELLGKINDLYMLADWIPMSKTSENASAFLEKIKNEVRSLQQEADVCGLSLYRFSPEEYSSRLRKAVQI